MTRNSPNYFALGCAILFLLLYLVLPFVNVILPISGWSFLQYSAVMCIPVILALLMVFASLLMDVRISIGIGALSLVTLLILLLLTRSILLNDNALAAMLTASVTQVSGIDSRLLSNFIPVTIGVGGIVCIVLCIAYVAVEVVMDAQKKPARQDAPNPFPF